MQNIAGVKPAHDSSCGSGEAGVKGVIHSFIPAAYPPGNVFFIFVDDVNGSIRGTAIDDDIFEIRVALVNDGADGFLNVANSVIYRGNKRDARPSRGFFL
jgi:hypothetical protein